MSNFCTDEHRFAALAYLTKHHSGSEPRVDHIEVPEDETKDDRWIFCIDGNAVTIEVDSNTGDCRLRADTRVIEHWIENEGNL